MLFFIDREHCIFSRKSHASKDVGRRIHEGVPPFFRVALCALHCKCKSVAADRCSWNDILQYVWENDGELCDATRCMGTPLFQ